MGTLRYISPEQVRGRFDHRSDMFSIGSVFYELLTLRPPFLGEDAMQLLEQLRTEDPPSPSEIDPTIPALSSHAPNTTRLRRDSTIAPAHMAHGSSVTYSVQPLRRQELSAAAASRIASTSACAVGS